MERRYERISYYLQLRADAEKKAEDNLRLAQTKKGFRGLYARWAGVCKGIYRAENDWEFVTVAELRTEKAKLEAKMELVLNSLGLTFEDLSPKRKCRHCLDTGYLKEGRFCWCFLFSQIEN